MDKNFFLFVAIIALAGWSVFTIYSKEQVTSKEENLKNEKEEINQPLQKENKKKKKKKKKQKHDKKNDLSNYLKNHEKKNSSDDDKIVLDDKKNKQSSDIGKNDNNKYQVKEKNDSKSSSGIGNFWIIKIIWFGLKSVFNFFVWIISTILNLIISFVFTIAGQIISSILIIIFAVFVIFFIFTFFSKKFHFDFINGFFYRSFSKCFLERKFCQEHETIKKNIEKFLSFVSHYEKKDGENPVNMGEIIKNAGKKIAGNLTNTVSNIVTGGFSSKISSIMNNEKDNQDAQDGQEN